MAPVPFSFCLRGISTRCIIAILFCHFRQRLPTSGISFDFFSFGIIFSFGILSFAVAPFESELPTASPFPFPLLSPLVCPYSKCSAVLVAVVWKSQVIFLRYPLLIWPFSLRDREISYFPMFSTSRMSEFPPHSSSEHGLSHSRRLAFPSGINLGSLVRSARFNSLSASPSLRSGSSSSSFSPLALQCCPATVVAE